MKKIFWAMSFSFIFIFQGCVSQPKKTTMKSNPSSYQIKDLSWIEVGENSNLIARSITTQTQCPTLDTDQGSTPMDVRARPSAEFPVLSCELSIPKEVQRAKIRGQNLSIPKSDPKRILVLGDTGCRIKESKGKTVFQNCQDPRAWPFPRIIQKAKDWKPDLVIHLGDYAYRENACPAGRPECEGSPYGFDWETWKADFFGPAQDLLASSPWVFVRGNHEGCPRAGEGWKRFLSVFPNSEKCTIQEQPYWARMGTLELAVLDTGMPADSNPNKSDIQRFTGLFQKIQNSPLKHPWLLTHVPLWGATAKHGAPDALYELNATLQAAWKKSALSKVSLILSGHVHLFQAITFEDEGPSQMIIGNGGTHLHPAPKDFSGKSLGKRKIKSEISKEDFGFMTVEMTRPHLWTAMLHNVEGKPAIQCFITPTEVICNPLF